MSQEECFPFKLAKINPPNLDISKRWYIEYKIWHHGKGELVLQRIMGNINRIHNKEERLKAAKSVRDEMNVILKEGHTIGKKQLSNLFLSTFQFPKPSKLHLK